MSPVALKNEYASKTSDTDLPFRTGLVIAAVLVALCFLSATITPGPGDSATMTMLTGP
jgi:hypothetical protein